MYGPRSVVLVHPCAQTRVALTCQLLGAWVCRRLVETLLSVLLSTHPEIGLLDQVGVPCLLSVAIAANTCFLKRLPFFVATSTRAPVSSPTLVIFGVLYGSRPTR